MTEDKPVTKTDVLVMSVVLVIALYLGYLVFGTVLDEQKQAFVNESEAWCDEHNGTLENTDESVREVSCVLPNGTSVNTSEVVQVNLSGKLELNKAGVAV